jgi:acetyl-CoA carboxylase, biotin carboxylase subunit
MFKKILVANRGEIARRVIRACHELKIAAVAVFSEADEKAGYLQEADEAVCIGPGPSSLSYLNQEALLHVAQTQECEAIHPGYGFLAENALFATMCEQQKLTFIGPRPAHIRLMGDKATARETMRKAGLPVIPGSSRVLQYLEEAASLASDIGYPILLKATAGGGGKGMRLVTAEAEIKDCFLQASGEAQKAFSNPNLYMEKYFINARHIEFQILADSFGRVIHLGERECSIQRNHQKLLEEAPAFGFSERKRNEMGQKICEALTSIGYLGVGTVEFLLSKSGELYFMEMNTRIQVEHPVTELVSGIDLVAWQIKIAAGERLSLSQDQVKLSGHAIECRINAEDPDHNFKPSPGCLTRVDVPDNSPQGPVRFDTHVAKNYQIPPFYDSMIGKLIVHGQNREAAIKQMQKVLQATCIEGVPTTLDLQRMIVSHPQFVEGGYNCGFLQEIKWQK